MFALSSTNMKKIYFAIILFLPFLGYSQKAQYKVAICGFYNLENYYDTIDNPIINDNEFTPGGEKNYNGNIYWKKVNKLATVISQIGTDVNPDGLALLGVAEIENDTVLTDLIHDPLLKKRNYKIVHYDSRDVRGVDVGLLYNPKYFTPEKSDKLFIVLPNSTPENPHYTRDILWVQGKLDGETINIYVNHWPSRLGGEERSAPNRAAAAMVCKKHMDSLALLDPHQKVIIMGDLNDDPISLSVIKVLNSKGKKEEVKEGGLFNPWVDMYKKGIGTIGYQDAWSLFDQIIISYSWLSRNQTGFFFMKQFIFNKEYMVENQGRFKGYPMRTWDGNTYREGYSDHFPTYIILAKKVETSVSPAYPE